jgi:dodecin
LTTLEDEPGVSRFEAILHRRSHATLDAKTASPNTDLKGIFAMANVVKVIEVLAESNKSWEDAAAQALRKASKTLKNIKSIYIKELEAKVDNNRITQYRINGKISFTLD